MESLFLELHAYRHGALINRDRQGICHNQHVAVSDNVSTRVRRNQSQILVIK